MTRIVVTSRVGTDGILHLDLPLGREEAGREVQVTIEPTPSSMSEAEWRAWVDAMAGSIIDPTFERPLQLPLDERASLP